MTPRRRYTPEEIDAQMDSWPNALLPKRVEDWTNTQLASELERLSVSTMYSRKIYEINREAARRIRRLSKMAGQP